MSKLSEAIFKGVSGTKYSFDVYKNDVIFKPDIAAVYVLSRRCKNSKGEFVHDIICGRNRRFARSPLESS